jgi:hypothetical protein
LLHSLWLLLAFFFAFSHFFFTLTSASGFLLFSFVSL